jgi:hypothetical protein
MKAIRKHYRDVLLWGVMVYAMTAGLVGFLAG